MRGENANTTSLRKISKPIFGKSSYFGAEELSDLADVFFFT